MKQALVGAKTNPLYSCIKASTYGLVFFATPHSGGNGASVADSAAKLCSALTRQAKNSLLETLEKAFPHLTHCPPIPIDYLEQGTVA